MDILNIIDWGQIISAFNSTLGVLAAILVAAFFVWVFLSILGYVFRPEVLTPEEYVKEYERKFNDHIEEYDEE